MNQKSRRLYGVILSPFVRKVLLVLELKSLDYEMVPIDPFNKPPDFSQISPLGKVPLLEEGDFRLPDSSAICQYLEASQPTPPLYPRTPKDLGRALWLEEYADTRLMGLISRVFRERVIFKIFQKRETNEDLVAEALQELSGELDYLEKQLPETAFFNDEIPGIADISICTNFFNAAHAGWEPAPSTHPRLSAYLARFRAHPVAGARLREEQQRLRKWAAPD